MSRLFEYRQLEKRIAQETAKLEMLKGDLRLEKEIEFETQLKILLQEYGKSLADVKSILDPEASRLEVAASPSFQKRTGLPRKVKVYRNPLTGEIAESKGGNNRLLSAWKAQFGHDEVESWVTP